MRPIEPRRSQLKFREWGLCGFAARTRAGPVGSMRLSFGAPFLAAFSAFLDSNNAVISAKRLFAELAFHAKDLDELAEPRCHAPSELKIGIKHGWHGFDGSALVE